MRSKFDKVKEALENKTRDTKNYITLIKNEDAKNKGKYSIQNVATKEVGDKGYNVLDDVIVEYRLDV